MKNLEIGGITAEKLVDNHGTPLFVYDAEKIREQYQKLENAFSTRYKNFGISFAVKSNFNPEIVKILTNEGAGLDCASKAEIMLAEKLEAKEVMYTAPYNRKDELQYAVDKGATVNLDALFLLDKLNKLPNEICFRIDPGLGKGDHGLVFGGGDTKFGVPKDKALEAYRKAQEKGIEKFGIHMMTGSNIRNPEYFGQITEKLLEITAVIAEELNIEFEFVDIGGGLGVPYKPEDENLDIEEVAEQVTKKFREGVSQNNIGNPQLRIEPGRFLVAQSGRLLTRVTGIKNKNGTEYVGIDTGMHHNIRPMLLNAYHHIIVANNINRPLGSAKTVVGPVCSSTDVMAEDRILPKIKQGDILSIEDVGAYGFTMASHWNSRPLPAEILVENGEDKVIREREELTDIFHGTELD